MEKKIYTKPCSRMFILKPYRMIAVSVEYGGKGEENTELSGEAKRISRFQPYEDWGKVDFSK